MNRRIYTIQHLVLDEEDRITVPLSERERLGSHPGDALLAQPTDDGLRLAVVAESLSDASLKLLDQADREGTVNVQEVIEHEAINVTAALRDVTLSRQPVARSSARRAFFALRGARRSVSSCIPRTTFAQARAGILHRTSGKLLR